MPNVFRGASRLHRPPKDSVKLLAAIFDNCLLDLGFDARRSNSIFATGSRVHAGDFGTVYMLFPINGFKFSYINEEDLVLDSFKYIIRPELYARIQEKFLIKNIKLTDWSQYFLRKNPTDLDAIIADLKEIIPDDPFIQSLNYDQLIDCEYIAQRYKPSETYLNLALTNDWETMFKGSYYALSFDTYFKQANKKLGFLIKQ